MSKTMITEWTEHEVTGSVLPAFSLITSEPREALKSIHDKAVHPYEWPTVDPSRVFIDPITGMLMPMGLSWSEPG